MGEKEKPGSASAEIGKYLDILAKDPNSRVFAPLAEAYRKAGLLDDAIETALEGLKVHPNYLGGRVALGRAYFEKRQYAEAAAEMQKVVKAAPDNLMAHKVLGQIAYGQNDLAAAEKSFKMVLLLDPRDLEAQQFIASISGGTAPPPPRSAPAPPVPPSPEPSAVGQRTSPEPPPVAAAPAAAIPEDLSIEDISLDAPLPGLGGLELPPPLASVSPEPAAAKIEEGSLIELPEIDFVGDEPEPRPAAAPVAAPAPAPAPAALELEIFAREPWGKERPQETPPVPPSPAPGAAPAAVSQAPAEEGPIEVFGRPKKGGPPQSSKGEQEAYAEIEFEPTAHAPVEAEPEQGESPFEVFTREPRGQGGGRATPPAGREERSAFGDIEIETTAYSPQVPGEDDLVEPAAVHLDEELPRIDLESEFGPGREEEPPVLEVEPVAFPDIEVPAAAPAFPEPEGEAPLDAELPQIGLAREVEPDFEEPEPDSAEPALEQEAPPARGVFDTETLAAIYIDQGFYGRAAEIYQRLLGQRPGDAALLQKLEEVRALERMGQEKEAAAAGPVEPPPAAHAAAGGAAEDRVRRLQTLLDAFKRGEPQ